MKYLKSHPYLTFKFNFAGLSHAYRECVYDDVCEACHEDEDNEETHIRALAKASVRIEGNQLSDEECEKVFDSRKAKGRAENELKNAYDLLIHDCVGFDKYTPDSICYIQEYLLKNTSSKAKTGSVRDKMVYVGSHEGAPTDECGHLLKKLSGWIMRMIKLYQREKSDEKYRYHGYIIAALAHQYIAMIHPFEDGNGRTARHLHWSILRKFGFSSESSGRIIRRCWNDRQGYYRALNLLRVMHGNKMGGVDFDHAFLYFIAGDFNHYCARLNCLSNAASFINYIES